MDIEPSVHRAIQELVLCESRLSAACATTRKHRSLAEEKYARACDELESAELALRAREQEKNHVEAQSAHRTRMHEYFLQRIHAAKDALSALTDASRRAEVQHELHAALRKIEEIESEQKAQKHDRAEARRAYDDARTALHTCEVAVRECERLLHDSAQHNDSSASAEEDTASLSTRIADLYESLPCAVRTRYEENKKRCGVGAVLFNTRDCEACGMDFSPGELQDFAATDDVLLECPNCGMLLVR